MLQSEPERLPPSCGCAWGRRVQWFSSARILGRHGRQGLAGAHLTDRTTFFEPSDGQLLWLVKPERRILKIARKRRILWRNCPMHDHTYRLYHLGREGDIRGAVNRSFRDDAEAFEHADHLLENHPAVEIWQTDR